MKKFFHILSTVIIFSFFSLNAQTKIEPDHSRIHIHGANFVKMVDGKLIMHRHSDTIYSQTTDELRFNPQNAQSGSGISIRFRTSSPTVKLNMQISDKKIDKKQKRGVIGIFQSKRHIKSIEHTSPAEHIKLNSEYYIDYERGKKFSVDIKSENVGKTVEYKIVLPLYMDLNLLNIELEDKYKLKCFRERKKPVYVAFGNSITQGTGQQITSQTYPYLISEWNNWELYNIAVGGAKTSAKMAEMVSDEFNKIDYMTILIGFNDYAGKGESPEIYEHNYTEIINIIRKNHPKTKLYCITFTTTLVKKSKKSSHVPEEFRNVVRKIVKDREANGDNNIYLIEGQNISELDWLNDKVHFSIDGVIKVADKLYYEIEKTN